MDDFQVLNQQMPESHSGHGYLLEELDMTVFSDWSVTVNPKMAKSCQSFCNCSFNCSIYNPCSLVLKMQMQQDVLKIQDWNSLCITS